MNQTFLKILSKIKFLHKKIFNPKNKFGISYQNAQITRQEASDIIYQKLMSSEPAMIARLGSVELNYLINCKYANASGLLSFYLYITNKIEAIGWKEDKIQQMIINAGFFPHNNESALKFYHLMIDSMKEVDILGVWLKEESFFKNELKRATKIQLRDIEPYYHSNPWSKALQGKKILVIYPTEESIKRQYKKRELLFKNKEVLPQFELIVIKAVQSIAGNPTQFKTWFDGLEYMKQKISETVFDIAIIGCGAYGFPLAAYVKKIGKKAIHMGGATQYLFGIYGNAALEHDFISTLINQHWVRPLKDEIPRNSMLVENGRYW